MAHRLLMLLLLLLVVVVVLLWLFHRFLFDVKAMRPLAS